MDNRIYKFRAWNTIFKKMEYDISVNEEEWLNSSGHYSGSHEHLMQYTGLKDKNGKESYFDDVLKWQDSTFRIVWDDEYATTMLRRLSGVDGMKEIPAHNIKDSEIIGNVYQNPEWNKEEK